MRKFHEDPELGRCALPRAVGRLRLTPMDRPRTTPLRTGTQILGATVGLTTVVRAARWLWKHTWLPRRPQGPRLADRYGRGSWALVTGAGDGLGKAFAQELAEYGFNLVLVSRTRAKLDGLSESLAPLGISVRVVCADLSDTSDATYELVAAATRDIDLALVVNCVGVTVHGRYADLPAATVRRLIDLNVTTTALITRATLPALLDHAATTGRRAALLDVGSIVGRFPWPGTQLYGATKAFVGHLTVPLGHEYRDRLDVLSFQPTVMSTAMAAGTEPAAITITPETAAHAALSHLGRYRTSHGHWRHALAAALFQILPTNLRDRLLFSQVLKMAEAERAKERLE